MSYEDQRRRYQQQRAERQVIDQAAAQLRHRAILAAYEGAERKEGRSASATAERRHPTALAQRRWSNPACLVRVTGPGL